MIYLDWAATSPPDPDIMDAVASIAVEYPGNPSSRHGEGRRAAALLEECRRRVAKVFDVSPTSLVFTSGASESNNIVLLSQLHRRGLGHIVVTELEHSSVRRPVRQLERLGFDVTVVRADSQGRVSPDAILQAVTEETVLVADSLVCSTNGAMLDVGEVSLGLRELSRGRNRHIHHHCDCVQAVGKVPFDLNSIGVDSAAFSAHKLRGPRGVGLLFLDRDIDPLITGGGQERDVRPGTENLAGVYGMTLALERYAAEVDPGHAVSLCEAIYEGLRGIAGAAVHPDERGAGSAHPVRGYSPYIVEVSCPTVPGEVLARVLSDRGCAVSTGSACATNLRASGSPERHTIRVSTGPGTTRSDVDTFVRILSAEVASMIRVLG